MNKILVFLCLVTTSLCQYSSNYLPPDARRTSDDASRYQSLQRSSTGYGSNGAYSGLSNGNGAYNGNGAAGRIGTNGAASSNGNGYSSNGYSGNGNSGSSSSRNGNGYSSSGNGYSSNGNGISGNGNGYSSNGNGYSSNGNSYSSNGNGYSSSSNGYSSNGISGNGNGYSNSGNGYSSNADYSTNGNSRNGLLKIGGFTQDGPVSSDEPSYGSNAIANGFSPRASRPANGNGYSQNGNGRSGADSSIGAYSIAGPQNGGSNGYSNGNSARGSNGYQNGQGSNGLSNGNGYSGGNGYTNGNGYQARSQFAATLRQDEENDPLSEPAKYEFKYDVFAPEYSVEFGHQEQRDGDLTEGSYYVLLPDGRRQLVEYTADQDGYKPRISYTEAAAGGANGQGGYQDEAGIQQSDNYQGRPGNYGGEQGSRQGYASSNNYSNGRSGQY